MPDRIQPSLFNAVGGLNTNSTAILLGRPEMSGHAINLINFEPGFQGYHRLDGFDEYQASTPAGDGACVGVAVHNGAVYAARVNGSNHRIFQWTGAWTQRSTGTLSFTAGDIVRSAQINFAGGQEIVFADGTNRLQHWDGSTWTNLAGTGAPTDPRYVAVYKNRIVAAGDSAATSTLYISQPTSAKLFDPASGALAIVVGDKINGIRTFRDSLYIFCDTTIKKLIGRTSAEFEIVDVTTDLGCNAPDSIVEIGGELLFWSDDGVRTIAGTDKLGDVEVGTLTVDIRPTVKAAVLQHDTRNIVGGVVRGKSQFRYFFSDSTAAEASIDGIMGAITKPATDNNYRWEFASILGINPSCFASGYIAGKEVVVHGGWDGEVYQQETGDSFNGTAIIGIYQTPFMDLGDPTLRKSFEKLFLYINATGSLELFMQQYIDYQDGDIIQPAEYDFIGDFDSAKYNALTTIYDNASTKYGSVTSPIIEEPLVGSGKTVSFKFVTIADQPSFSIQGGAILWKPEGTI